MVNKTSGSVYVNNALRLSIDIYNIMLLAFSVTMMQEASGHTEAPIVCWSVL